MSDEAKFHRALMNARNYNNIYLEFEVRHPTNPISFLKIDNLGQKGKTLFVFEGKKGGLPEKAIPQLKKAYLSLKNQLNKFEFLKTKRLNPYEAIRLIYYSFKRGLLIELNPKGAELNQYRFNPRDLNNLSEILRNL